MIDCIDITRTGAYGAATYVTANTADQQLDYSILLTHLVTYRPQPTTHMQTSAVLAVFACAVDGTGERCEHLYLRLTTSLSVSCRVTYG